MGQPVPSDDAAAYLAAQIQRLETAAAPPDRLDTVDRTLSMAASLTNPEAGRTALALALAGSIHALLDLEQVERARGVHAVSGDFIRGVLPADSVDGAVFRIAEGQLLQSLGRLEPASRALDEATAGLRVARWDPALRVSLLAHALSLQAAVCVARGDDACAATALAEHPYAPLYAAVPRAPAAPEEVAYLAARALAEAHAGRTDTIAAAALARPVSFDVDAADAARLSVYRAAGRALGLPPGPARAEAMAALGRALRDAADAPAGVDGWRRPDAVDRILIAAALAQAPDPGVAFALHQLSARVGAAFDADATTALSLAKTPDQRRAVHQLLRLRARRDRLERVQIQAVVARAAETPPRVDLLRHDAMVRRTYGEFARRIGRAEAELRDGGLRLAGANLVTLAGLQDVLAPNEAALSVAAVDGGLAYLCVRNDRSRIAMGAADPARLRLDGRLVQSALTAGHPPSEALDAQFPVEPAMRLYDALIRPFETCLKPGDRIVWLPGVASVSTPLAVLLRSAPPRRGDGHDLAAADWLVRRHAVSYAGSASVIVASRRGGAGASPSLDFLGVGDPVLSVESGAGVTRSVRAEELAGLAPLPETRDELLASSRTFRAPRLLLGPEATERRVRGEVLGAYRFLSFATHGLIRDDLQGLSEPALVLTPVAEDQPADDGLLTATEIADLELQARFVAMSACNTANFDLGQMAQDLPALASAFAVAGAPSALGSLWPVDSETARRVVSDLFTRLGAGDLGPAAALAEAQRRFLAAPPGRAWLHPRFWAAFVILGEGGPSVVQPPSGALALASLETLTRNGGEVLAVSRQGVGAVARFISDLDAGGRHGAGVRLGDPKGEAWRTDVRTIGASRFLARLGEAVLVSGYQRLDDGRFVPTLETVDVRTGRSTAAWRGDVLGLGHSFVLGGAQRGGGEAVVLVGEPGGEGDGPRLNLLSVEEDLAPTVLAAWRAPPGARLSDATVTAWGDDLLVTYADRTARPLRPPPPAVDDYEAQACAGERVTWIEHRDGRTGALKAARSLPGVAVVAAAAVGGRVLLAGSAARDCAADGEAVVLALAAGLQLAVLHHDRTPGASEVRSLSPLPDGRVLVAASKTAVFDPAAPVDLQRAADPYRLGALPFAVAAQAYVLDPAGRASPPLPIDAGGGVFVSGGDASDPADILLGGAVGGEAAILHLRATR